MAKSPARGILLHFGPLDGLLSWKLENLTAPILEVWGYRAYKSRHIPNLLNYITIAHQKSEDPYARNMASAGAPYDPSKFRVLVLHGFAENGSQIGAKARPISNRITKLLTPEILPDFPGGIEFLYPDAPLILEHPIGLGINSEDSKEAQESERPQIIPLSYEEEGSNLLGWWYGRDIVSRYRGIEASLSYLATYIHGRPIHGVLGFSQGGAVAGMISSLLNCSGNPAMIGATRAQGLPVDSFLQLPGQKALRFCISIGGYRGTAKYYGSLYQWPIQTPSIHTLASMDAVVEHYATMELAKSFSSYEIVQYYGSHFCPRDIVTVEALARFALRNCYECSAAPVPFQSVNMFNDGIRSDSGRTASGNRYSRRSDFVRFNKSATRSTIWRRRRETYVTWEYRAFRTVGDNILPPS